MPGELIETTPEHPFFVVGSEWVNAGELQTGDTVVSFDGDKGILANGTVISVERIEEPQIMYNLTVEEAHTFFVGEGEWLVYNSGPCLTSWGDTGTDLYRSVVNAIRTNTGTLEQIGGLIPTRLEAEKLIAEAEGKILRVERGHPLPNPHTYPHINYTVDGKNVLTIRVQGVGRQYFDPSQKGYSLR